MITLNQEQRLYVIPCNKGFTCIGFDIAYERAKNAAQFAGLPLPQAEIGTQAAYDEYSQIMANAAEFAETNKIRCEAELTSQLVGLEGKRVEVETAYGETRRFWVGKSTGWTPCHLEIAKSNSHGGPAAEKEYKSVRIVR